MGRTRRDKGEKRRSKEEKTREGKSNGRRLERAGMEDEERQRRWRKWGKRENEEAGRRWAEGGDAKRGEKKGVTRSKWKWRQIPFPLSPSSLLPPSFRSRILSFSPSSSLYLPVPPSYLSLPHSLNRPSLSFPFPPFLSLASSPSSSFSFPSLSLSLPLPPFISFSLLL